MQPWAQSVSETAVMAKSKLEQFRDGHFPADSFPADSPPAGAMAEPGQGGVGPERWQRSAHPRSRERASSSRPRRGPVGRVFLALKLVLMFGPLALLLLSTLADCGPRASSSLMPHFVQATACARRDVLRHVDSLESTFRTISDRMR